ncbi:MAG TPA: ABC transporter substrate-binding protein [Clostridia bacterium]|nr:ABC transporter substrate-binding protein [Clostridia bacterium]
MKNKRLFKIVVLVFSFCLIITFSACKKADNPTGTATVTPEGTATQGPSGGLGFGGITIRAIRAYGRGAEPLSDNAYEKQLMDERIREMEENYNFKFEWVVSGVAAGTYSDHWTSILTGKPIADIARVDYWVITQSLEKGGHYAVLNDYDDILELDSSELWDQMLIKELYTIEGMTFGAESYKYGVEQVYQGAVMFFNKSMLEREGIWDEYNLYDMQREKTWTWDTLDTVATRAVKDRTGDGITDQFGLICKYSITHMGFNASNSNGGTGWGWYEVDREGKPVFRGREPERLRVLNYFHDMGQTGKGWLHAPDFGTDSEWGPDKFFAEGNSAFIIDNGHNIELFSALKMQDTLGVVAVPMGPDNTKGYNIARVYYKPWVMAKNASNFEACAYVIKEISRPLYTKEEADISVEVALADFIGNETEILETYKMLSDPERVAYNKETPFIATWAGVIASYHGSFASAIIEAGFPPEQLNELYGDAIQTFINDYWALVLESAQKIKKKRQENGLQ